MFVFQVMFHVGQFGNVVRVTGNSQAEAMKAVKDVYPKAEIKECEWLMPNY